MTEHSFLLTDIESSTRLWERDWDAMAAAMAHHETVVAGVVLRDLGTFTLRDLAEPERVLQLCHPDLRDDFPPPRAPHPSVEHLHAIVDDLALDLLRLPANAPTLGLSGRIELSGTKRSAFLEEVKPIFEPLSCRYGVRSDGDEYRIAFACYPEVVR